MEVKTFSLKENQDRDIYGYLDVKECQNSDFQFKFSLNFLKKNEELYFNNEGMSTQFYVLSEGLYFAQNERKYKATTDSMVLSATMANNVRGNMRRLNINGSVKMRVGEAVGACVIAFFGADAEFTLKWDDESILCTTDSAVFLTMEKAEYHTIYLVSKKGNVHLEYAGFAVLGQNDFGKNIGIELIKGQNDKYYGKLEIRPEHLNPLGVVHGGCIFTLADAVCGFTIGSLGGISTTVNSYIQYFNPSFSPEYLIAEVKPRKLGKSIRHLDVEVRDDHDVLVACAEFVFCNLQK